MYVLDTNSLGVFRFYYPDQFPSFWESIDALVTDRRLTSVRQVKQELDKRYTSGHLAEWAARHEGLFPAPSIEEMRVVADVFSVRHFQQLIDQRSRLRGDPVADPWVIARAAALEGCVVTEEKPKPNSAKIPNVCSHFDIECCNVEGMLRREGLSY